MLMDYCLDSLRLNSPGILPTPSPHYPRSHPLSSTFRTLTSTVFVHYLLIGQPFGFHLLYLLCFPLLTSIATISQPCLASDNLVPNCTSHFFSPKEPSVLPGWSFSFPDEYSGNFSPITLSSPSAQPNYPHQNSFPQTLKETLPIFQSRI